MAYVQRTWKNARVEYPSRRKLIDNDNNEEKIVTVVKDPGNIIQSGDEWNATNMNDLEKRINDGFVAAHEEVSGITGEVGALVTEAREISSDIHDIKNEIDLIDESVSDALTTIQQGVISVNNSVEICQDNANHVDEVYGNVVNKYNDVVGLTNNAKEYSETSEAYAVGTRNGIDVNSNDPAYHNNAKYYLGKLDDKMDANNPTGTGYFSLNRKEGSPVGNYSFTEGQDNVASGVFSHAEGRGTEANGYASHAQNIGTIADYDGQTVIGKYNEPTPAIFIVGNGRNEDARSNAMTVDDDGNVVIGGDLKYGVDKKSISDLASVEYVDTVIEDFATTEYVDNSVSNLATSEYVDNAISDFITSDYVDNAVSSFITSDYVDNAISNALENFHNIKYQIEESLPETGEENIIYLIPKASPTVNDFYDEYIWIYDHWEQTNTMNISLDGYAKIEDIPTKLSELENDSDYVIDTNYVHTDNNLTDELVEKINSPVVDSSVYYEYNEATQELSLFGLLRREISE